VGQRLMLGVISAIAMLVSGGTPEVPTAAAALKTGGAPVATAVDLGRKWGVVTSVRRTPERNRAVGGAENSFHLYGRAIDIARRPGVRHAEIEAAYRRAGYVLIESLDEGDHSHFAFGRIDEAPRKTIEAPPVLAVTEQACPPSGHPELDERRRPDRSYGCAFSDESRPRLRPLVAAP